MKIYFDPYTRVDIISKIRILPFKARPKPGCFIFYAILFFCGIICQAQPEYLRFETIPNFKLPTNPFYPLLQDRKGFLWFGSYDGLVRYDGISYRVFRNDLSDQFSIGDDKITCAVEDKNGTIWVGTQNGLNSFDPVSEKFTRYNTIHEKGNWINTIFQSKEGKIWFTVSQIIKMIDPDEAVSNKGNCISDPPIDLSNIKGTCFWEDIKKRIWIGSINGLYRLDGDKQPLKKFNASPNPTSPEGNWISCGFESSSGEIWIGTGEGVSRFNEQEQTFDPIILDIPKYPGLENTITGFHEEKDGKLWITTRSGIVLLDTKTLICKRFKNDKSDLFSLIGDVTNQALQDRTGIVWVPSILSGLNKYIPTSRQVTYFTTKPTEVVEVMADLYGVMEFNPGEILIPRKDGLNLLEWKKGKFKPFPYKPESFPGRWDIAITCYHETKERKLWIGTGMGNVFIFDRITNKFSFFTSSQIAPDAKFPIAIRDLNEDKFGNVWVATWSNGVYRYDIEKNNFRAFLPDFKDSTSISNPNTRKIFLDRSGNIWIGTRGGLNKFNYETETFTSFAHNPENPNSISENTVFYIFEDEEGIFWIGTFGGGLNRFDPKTGKFSALTTKDGLTHNSIFGLTSDRDGFIWLGTGKGICKFDPKTLKFTQYDHRNGFWDHDYNAFSFYKSPYSDEIFFEGNEGLYIFHPDSLKTDTTRPELAFTGFSIFNESVQIAKSKGDLYSKDTFFLPQSITVTKQLAIPYRHKVIAFEFAALHFAAPEKNQYAYMLEGFDKDWQYIGTRRSVTFTNLNPGKYTLRVKASNADGVWNEEGISMVLIIIPPWWHTWWAYGLYALTFGLILFWIYRRQHEKDRLKLDLEYKAKEAERLKELDILKSRFYTNITHEFRTPLTVISGMAEKIRTNSKEWVETGTEMIRRNSDQLLKLVNQMLDLRKIESGAMKPEFVQGNIVEYIRFISESFSSLAESKGIDLHFQTAEDVFITDFDREKLGTILSNLLSNAVKFTPENGRIDLRISQVIQDQKPACKIEVEDTGVGIPPKELSKIFDRFYQVDDSPTRQAEGTGIGLALCKELVQFLNGDIYASSTPGEGACFTVVLPVSNTAKMGKEGIAQIAAIESVLVVPSYRAPGSLPGMNSDAGLAEILIVEDNEDVKTYLIASLQDQYRIMTASNGEEGVQKAIERVPDMIISDVMMPVMDGFELCRILKSDFRTSHIPIILLTAKTALEDRIAGLERGADAYLDKPFKEEELRVRIRKLIELRQQLRGRYEDLSVSQIPSPPDKAFELEDEFLQKARAIVEKHLDDAEFDVPQFCRAMGVSRTQLHNKLTALTGKSASEYVRTLRLLRGKELLANPKMNISEIAYAVGFTDPNYFGRRFREMFGVTPGEYRKKES